jgi:RNA polymerase sigma-70 factor (ECF subfamily)
MVTDCSKRDLLHDHEVGRNNASSPMSRNERPRIGSQKKWKRVISRHHGASAYEIGMSFTGRSRPPGLAAASDSATPPQSGAEQNLSALVEDLLPASIGTTALNEALPGIYDELRALAAGYLRGERPNHTLQPTALVHESYLRLVKQHSVDWGNRLQFLSIAARMMRRILSNHASARATNKRDSGEPCLELDAALDFYDRKALSITAVDEALRDLEAMDPRQSQVVELRFFGGLTIEETAKVMNLSLATVKRDWVTARRWLQREISGKA